MLKIDFAGRPSLLLTPKYTILEQMIGYQGKSRHTHVCVFIEMHPHSILNHDRTFPSDQGSHTKSTNVQCYVQVFPNYEWKTLQLIKPTRRLENIGTDTKGAATDAQDIQAT